MKKSQSDRNDEDDDKNGQNGSPKKLSKHEPLDQNECSSESQSRTSSPKPPIDAAYQPKVVKCQVAEGSVLPVSRKVLREASISADVLSPSILQTSIPRESESRVMVLYTGGTIGMKIHNGAYRPEPNYLPQAIREIPHLNDVSYAEAHFGNLNLKPYVLPPVKGEDRRVVYWVFEYEPLLDSSDMTFDDWIKIGKDIYSSYEEYDGFVILHGTDTLSYTASALSYMFENLGKPVILTGAQIPVAEVRSDGRENLIGALIIAANYDIPEVSVYFNNKLLRGNRASKVDNSALDAFNSPNTPPLATTEIHIQVNYDNIYRSCDPKKVNLHTALNRNVGLLRIFPSVTIECIRAFLIPPLQGVVLQTFGAGNIPSQRKDIIEEIKKAIARGVIIVNCSQCARGQVDAQYHTGVILYDAGVIPGSDMTPEAALTKLAYVLGKDDWDLKKKKRMMQSNLRGELTVAQHRKSIVSLSDSDLLSRMAKFLHISTSEEMVLLRDTLFPPLVCSAAAAGDVALLQNLKDNGAVLHHSDYDKRTAMHVAAANGRLEAVKFLLSQGVSVHAKDRFDATPLVDAVRKCHFNVIKALTNAGAHLKMSAVALAIELCSDVHSKNIVRLTAWKMAGADFSVGDYDSRTPLHVAASLGYAEIVEYLLDNGSNMEARDSFGANPLKNAKENGHMEVAEMIKNHEVELAEIPKK